MPCSEDTICSAPEDAVPAVGSIVKVVATFYQAVSPCITGNTACCRLLCGEWEQGKRVQEEGTPSVSEPCFISRAIF